MQCEVLALAFLLNSIQGEHKKDVFREIEPEDRETVTQKVQKLHAFE